VFSYCRSAEEACSSSLPTAAASPLFAAFTNSLGSASPEFGDGGFSGAAVGASAAVATDGAGGGSLPAR
jgi:hypothetical protein